MFQGKQPTSWQRVSRIKWRYDAILQRGIVTLCLCTGMVTNSSGRLPKGPFTSSESDASDVTSARCNSTDQNACNWFRSDVADVTLSLDVNEPLSNFGFERQWYDDHLVTAEIQCTYLFVSWQTHDFNFASHQVDLALGGDLGPHGSGSKLASSNILAAAKSAERTAEEKLARDFHVLFRDVSGE